MFDEARDARRRGCVPISVEHLDRGLVAVVRQLGHQRAGDLAPLGERPAERRVGLLARRSAAPSRASAVPEASVSRQPWLGQLPWHGGPSLSIDHVAELGARADRAAVELAAEDQPAADAGADRQHDRRRVAPCAAPARCSASAATFASLSTTPAARAARPSRRGTARRRAAGSPPSSPSPRALVDQAGDPEADRGRPRRVAAARTSSTASTTPSSSSRCVEPCTRAVHAVVDVEVARRPRRRAASCRRGRRR